MPGYFQPVAVHAPVGTMLSAAGEGGFDAPQPAPLTAGMLISPVYRLRVTNIPGNPGGLLGKDGEGFSPGVGLIVTTPVGPLRLEVATENFTDNWRFNLGVGWKF